MRALTRLDRYEIYGKWLTKRSLMYINNQSPRNSAKYVFYLGMCPVVHRRSEMIFPTNITDISKVKVVLQ